MSLVSIVVPTYNAARYLACCLDSLLAQTHHDIEVVVADDCSEDETRCLAQRYADQDARIAIVPLARNCGTLQARKAGVAATHGVFVMLVDQDDELAPDAVERFVTYAQSHDADIYHCAVKVVAENAAAAQAAAGMEGFLTPPLRRLEGEDVLKVQLAEEGGFDWHVHHKMYRGEFLREAYAAASDERLVVADDIYMSFILCSRARAYEAIRDSRWYRYHLGRGETYGGVLDIAAFTRLAQADGDALRMAREYAYSACAPTRSDWSDRLDDLRDRLAFHTMNEWMDNLPDELKQRGCEIAATSLPADSVCGEIYRFVRDAAYSLLQTANHMDAGLEYRMERYRAMAKSLETREGFNEYNGRYRAMKEVSERHIMELEQACLELKRRGWASRAIGWLRRAAGRCG